MKCKFIDCKKKVTDFNDFIQTQTGKFVDDFSAPFTAGTAADKEGVVKLLEGFFAIDDEGRKTLLTMEPQEFRERFEQNATTSLAQKEKNLGPGLFKEAVKTLFISTIDYYFTEHLTSIEDLREGINLRGYAQLDPLVEYKKESFKFFNTMLQNIRTDFFRRLLHLEIDQRQQTTNPTLPVATLGVNKKLPKKSDVQTLRPSDLPRRLAPRRSGQAGLQTGSHKLSRNDPCWCGKKDVNGKSVKWKKCHYPQLPQ